MPWISYRKPASRQRPASRSRFRCAQVERLEDRSLLASLPYGAAENDTAEFMLGKVHVSVVLMESTPTMSPGDNGTVRITPPGNNPPYNFHYIPENWTPEQISGVKNKVIEATNWWEQTLDNQPNVPDGLLDFEIDFTYADSPVPTGYEPIARQSDDSTLWVYDFLNTTGLPITGNFNTDIRTYNNFQRERTGSDWAFTIFVVNDTNDSDKQFNASGSFDRSFAYAGGRFAVLLSSRPASIFAHEMGHIFWALDEYDGLGNYGARRGYYNTQNTNSAENPSPGFVQAPSLMSNDPGLTQAYNNFTSSPQSLQMIGWLDSDDDGIFDVLDVPFKLDGSGYYDSASGIYRFQGDTAVATLPNMNSSGLRNDITINQIRVAEYSIDNGPWQVAASFSRTYETSLDLQFAVPAGEHTIRIRTHDTVTGAMSPEFIGSTSSPSSYVESGIEGFLYRDDNRNGTWDPSELPLTDWVVNLVDDLGNPLSLSRTLEPSSYINGTNVSSVIPGVHLSALGGEVSSQYRQVYATTSNLQPSAGKVFGVALPQFASTLETWRATRYLRIDFDDLQTSVSLRALSSGPASYGRLEAYDSQGQLVGRYTTDKLVGSSSELMSIELLNPEIQYVLAFGHMNTEVVLDTLTVGPPSSAVTDARGAYTLPYLPGGDYRIAVDPLPTFESTTGGSELLLSLTDGQIVSDVNFGFAIPGSPWHNGANPLSVNGDDRITAYDALLVINWLNANLGQSATLPAIRNAGEFFIDVNNDGRATAYDALLVINWLNANLISNSPGEAEPPPDGTTNPGDGNPGDGDGGDTGGGDEGGGDGGGTSGTIIELPTGPTFGDGEGEGEPTLFAPLVDSLVARPQYVFNLAAYSPAIDSLTSSPSSSPSLSSYVDSWAADLLFSDDDEFSLRRLRRK